MEKNSITSGIYLLYDKLELSEKEINALKFFLDKGRAYYLVAALTSIPILVLAINHSHDSVFFNILFGGWILFITMAIVKTVPLMIMAALDILRSMRRTSRKQYFRQSVALIAAVFGYDRFNEKAGRKPNSLKVMPDYLFLSKITEEAKKALLIFFAEKLNFYFSECSQSDAHILSHNLMKIVKGTGKVFIEKYSNFQESQFLESLGDTYKMSKATIFRTEKILKGKNAPFRIDGNHNFVLIPKENKEIELKVNKILNINGIK